MTTQTHNLSTDARDEFEMGDAETTHETVGTLLPPESFDNGTCLQYRYRTQTIPAEHHRIVKPLLDLR